MPFSFLALGLGFGAVVCSGSSSCSRHRLPPAVPPAPVIRAPAARLTGGTFSRLSILEAEQSAGETPAAQFGGAGCAAAAGRNKSRGRPGQRVPGSPRCQAERNGRPREYTDRLMAAADTAQLDFASPFLKESASLPR